MGKPKPDGVYDRTALYANDEGRRVHRDYAAHYFRWGWAIKNRDIGIGERSTLDIGCGIDFSLLNVGLECIEHMPVEEGWKLLWGARQLLAPGGIFLLSTPVFNGKMAPNHIHEYTIDELQKYVKAAGFRVVKRYGTYANVRDSLQAIDEWAAQRGYDTTMFRALWNELGEYYTTDVLATFVAPAIPDASRNNVWHLELA